MVRQARFLGILLVALTTLFGCDYLFNGLFPGDVSQQTAVLDLSSEVSALDATTFTLSIMRMGKTDYVLLFSGSGFDGSKNHLYVISPDLSVQNRFTMNDIGNTPPLGAPLKGNAAVVHFPDGKIIIGNLVASPGGAGLSITGKLTGGTSAELRDGAIAGPSSASFTWTEFGSNSPGELHYRQYASDWTSSSTHSLTIGKPYWLRTVLTDPEDSQSNGAVLVFEENSSSTSKQYFVPVPKDPDMVNGFPGPALFDNPAYASFSMSELDTSHMYATADGIVSYDYMTSSLIHFTPTTTGSPVRMRVGQLKNDLRMAFSFSGSFYCVWDPDTRILTRYEKWW